LLLALPWTDGKVFREFFGVFVTTVGSPLWWTCWLLLALYVWAWIRGVRMAPQVSLAAGALFAIVGPRTVDVDSFVQPRPWPLLIIGVLLFAHGIRARSSVACTAAALVGAFGLWWLAPQTALGSWRTPLCLNALWFAILIVGISFTDPFARILRGIAAALFPAAAFFAVTASAERAPREWICLYVALLVVACLVIAVWRRS
jgi:hypothetical protein